MSKISIPSFDSKRIPHLISILQRWEKQSRLVNEQIEVIDLSAPAIGGVYQALVVCDQPPTSFKFQLATQGWDVAIRGNTLEINLGDKQ